MQEKSHQAQCRCALLPAILVIARGIANATLDGFSITGGNAKFNEIDYLEGGGISVSNSTLTISNCHIHDNIAEFDGAGIGCQGASYVRLVRSSITDNRAGRNGGGLHSSREGQIAAISCLISRNEAANYGGGLWIEEIPFRLEDCEISHNSCFDRAIYCYMTAKGYFIRCRILDNEGVAAYAVGGDIALREFLIQGNHGDGLELGGYTQRNTVCYASLVNCMIGGNVGETIPGIIWRDPTNVTIANSTIAGNR